MNVECRAYREDDREQCLDLLRRGHDRGFSAERFAWLHEAGPAGPSQKIVCEAAGQVVGLYAVLKRPATLDGRPVVAGRDVDPVVDPAWRGRGLFTRMLDWQLASGAGIDLHYNFANAASSPGFLKRGWTVADRLVDRVAQLGPRPVLSREGLLWIAGRVLRPRSSAGTVRELAAADVAALSAPRIPPDRRFAVQRTADFLSWRYLRCPLHTYRFFGRFAHDDLFDLLVVRVDPARRRLLLVDCAVYHDAGGAFASYLPWLEETLGAGWVGIWSSVPA